MIDFVRKALRQREPISTDLRFGTGKCSLAAMNELLHSDDYLRRNCSRAAQRKSDSRPMPFFNRCASHDRDKVAAVYFRSRFAALV